MVLRPTTEVAYPSTEIFIQQRICSFFLFTDNLHSECLNVVFAVPLDVLPLIRHSEASIK